MDDRFELYDLKVEIVKGEHTAPETVRKLKHTAELLQFDETASAYLMAEYQVHGILSDIYRILADAVGVDLSYLEG